MPRGSQSPGKKRRITRSQQEVIVLIVVVGFVPIVVVVVRCELKIDSDTLENSHLSEKSE